MTFAKDTSSTNAMGGTELMKHALAARIPAERLEDFQIFMSRVEEPLDESKIRLLWLHDLPGDPASEHLRNGGWRKFHRLIFASNWQMQAYINHYQIPWSKCIVLQNAIEPIPNHKKPTTGPIRLAYWSTPHRGLNILVPVFNKLCERFDNIELDVYSSFNLYGWGERDKPYEDLFEACRNHPKINYHGSVPNETIRENLQNTHILSYPSTWPETSCITLMEAMSAGMMCVHPNFAALYETAANWTMQYQYVEDINDHANMLYVALSGAIEHYWDDSVQSRLDSQKAYANVFYNWEFRVIQWEAVLSSLMNEPREIPSEPAGDVFTYKV